MITYQKTINCKTTSSPGSSRRSIWGFGEDPGKQQIILDAEFKNLWTRLNCNRNRFRGIGCFWHRFSGVCSRLAKGLNSIPARKRFGTSVKITSGLGSVDERRSRISYPRFAPLDSCVTHSHLTHRHLEGKKNERKKRQAVLQSTLTDLMQKQWTSHQTVNIFLRDGKKCNTIGNWRCR